MRLCIRVLPRVLYAEGETDVLQSCLSHPLSKQEEAAVVSSSLNSHMLHPFQDQNQDQNQDHSQNQYVNQNQILSQNLTTATPTAAAASQTQSLLGELVTPSHSATSARAGGQAGQWGQGGMWGGGVVRVTGPPRLWYRAVKVAAGYEEYSLTCAAVETIPEVNPNAIFRKNKIKGRKLIPPPAIVLFLMSDALDLLKGDLRAHPSPFKSTAKVSSTLPSGTPEHTNKSTGIQTRDSTRKFNIFSSPIVNNRHMDSTADRDIADNYIDEELHYTVYQHWLRFQNWGLNPHKYGTPSFSKNMTVPMGFDGAYGPGSVGNSVIGRSSSSQKRVNANGDSNDTIHFHLRVRKDPIYLVIQATITEYKLSQIRLCDALAATARHVILRTLASSSPLDYPSTISTKVAFAALSGDGGQGHTPVSTRKITRTVRDFELLHAVYMGKHNNNSSSSGSSSSGRGGGGEEGGEGEGSTIGKSSTQLHNINASKCNSIDWNPATSKQGSVIGINHKLDASSKLYVHASDARTRDLPDNFQSPILPIASLFVPRPDPVFASISSPLYSETPVQAAFDPPQTHSIPNATRTVEVMQSVLGSKGVIDSVMKINGITSTQGLENVQKRDVVKVEAKKEVKVEIVKVEARGVNKEEVDAVNRAHSAVAQMLTSTPDSARASLSAVSTTTLLCSFTWLVCCTIERTLRPSREDESRATHLQCLFLFLDGI